MNELQIIGLKIKYSTNETRGFPSLLLHRFSSKILLYVTLFRRKVLELIILERITFSFVFHLLMYLYLQN